MPAGDHHCHLFDRGNNTTTTNDEDEAMAQFLDLPQEDNTAAASLDLLHSLPPSTGLFPTSALDLWSTTSTSTSTTPTASTSNTTTNNTTTTTCTPPPRSTCPSSPLSMTMTDATEPAAAPSAESLWDFRNGFEDIIDGGGGLFDVDHLSSHLSSHQHHHLQHHDEDSLSTPPPPLNIFLDQHHGHLLPTEEDDDLPVIINPETLLAASTTSSSNSKSDSTTSTFTTTPTTATASPTTTTNTTTPALDSIMAAAAAATLPLYHHRDMIMFKKDTNNNNNTMVKQEPYDPPSLSPSGRVTKSSTTKRAAKKRKAIKEDPHSDDLDSNNNNNSDDNSNGPQSAAAKKYSISNVGTSLEELRAFIETLERDESITPKEKRQIRNKISARNFRVRKKEYVTTLEEELRVVRTENNDLKQKVEKYERENTDLKMQLDDLKKCLGQLSLAGSASSNTTTTGASSTAMTSAPINIPTIARGTSAGSTTMVMDENDYPNHPNIANLSSQRRISPACSPNPTNYFTRQRLQVHSCLVPEPRFPQHLQYPQERSATELAHEFMALIHSLPSMVGPATTVEPADLSVEDGAADVRAADVLRVATESLKLGYLDTPVQNWVEGGEEWDRERVRRLKGVLALTMFAVKEGWKVVV
ncbi:hypothetical protein HDU85_007305 [Gaertneriomyces sp. JEL0708]|nr:hypothetical protein HDU85_007305 [Gaertneriomyces sp. JEL0708]